MTSEDRFYRIGEVARICGLHEQTLRTLERRGLVRPLRDWNAQRRYTASDVEAVRALIATPQAGRCAAGAKGRRSGGVRRAGA